VNDTIAIRAGTPADLAHVCEHWLAMFEEVGKHFERDFPANWRSNFRSYFEGQMAADEAAFFVAVDRTTIVGTSGALVRDGYPAAITQLREGYIFGVRVAPEYRGRGIAEYLTREAIAYLERSNCRSIRLHASRFGRSIYERIGFVPTNEMELPRSQP
jgi:ribosomal protein S18 acetylase RimI-like enzyme